MKERTCPVCSNHSHYIFTKLNTHYFKCTSCRFLFCDELSQIGLVGGEHEIGRNESQNELRINRINELTVGSKKEDVHIMDFGAGSGYLVRDLKDAGYPNVIPYDAYNPEFSSLPPFNKFHLVTMVEVVEHIPPNFFELDFINKCLLPGGILYLETSFVDIAEELNIPLSEFFYANPAAGHSSIHSHHSLDLLLCSKNFMPIQHINKNVRLFRKVNKK